MTELKRGKWTLLCVPGEDSLCEEIARTRPGPQQCARVLRDDQHAFVGVFSHKGQEIVAKSPRYKDRRRWIRFMTLFRPGFAFRILGFMQTMHQAGIPSPAPILAMEQRRRGMVRESWIYYHYVPGRTCGEDELAMILRTLMHLHDLGWIHGDAQFRNYITDGEQAYLIDPDPRRKRLGRISAAYDFILLRNSLRKPALEFPIPRDSFAYRVAHLDDAWIHRWREVKRALRK